MNQKTMRPAVAVLLLGIASATTSCRTAHDVAVTSFRVVDAPAHYLRRQIDAEEQQQQTTTTTTTTKYGTSDVSTPGQPIAEAPPQGQTTTAHPTSRTTAAATSDAPAHARVSDTAPATTRTSPAPSTSPHPAASQQQAQLPYGKPVPGKPGYVFSPFDPNGGYVDVTGYTPGSKVKDPYSGKIFLVP
jgi:hypothetical protein